MKINTKILKWYDLKKRVLPWRNRVKGNVDPYLIWISEIMLQQTTVNAVIPYFNKFIKVYPNIFKLANSSLEDVLILWAGLGYYARARNLYKCSQIISKKYNGIFPNNVSELRKLPGIGDYTAAAISSIAFNQVAFAVDVNIHRVISRLFNKHSISSKEIKFLMKNIISENRPGDFTEALMDIGSQICKKRLPKCSLCPLIKDCLTFKFNHKKLDENKIIKKKKINKYGKCIIISRSIDKYIYFIRLPESGLFGGMLSLPISEWVTKKESLSKFYRNKGLIKPNEEIRYELSHFKLILYIYYLEDKKFIDFEGKWMPTKKARPQLSSLMKKVIDKYVI